MTPDEENTWRALKDQIPLVTSWLCGFRIHKWTKWCEPFRYGSYYYQTKECVHCNAKRKQSVDGIIGPHYS